MYYCEVPEISICSLKYNILKFKPPGKIYYKNNILVHFMVPVYLQQKEV